MASAAAVSSHFSLTVFFAVNSALINYLCPVYYKVEGVQQFLGDMGEDTNYYYHVLVPSTLCLASTPVPPTLPHDEVLLPAQHPVTDKRSAGTAESKREAELLTDKHSGAVIALTHSVSY
jgi:hypothetical protein